MSAIIRFFRDGQASDVNEIGGKGMNLTALTRAGFAVPEWFCVSTEAYRQFLRETGSDAQIASRFQDVDLSTLEEVRACGKAARDIILKSDLTDAISKPILTAYCQLFTRPQAPCPQKQKPEESVDSKLYVAVRSSATVEDSPGLSFAGQHDTYLNIFGSSSLLHAVKQCWVSLWSDRAIAYRHKHGIDHTQVLMAVIVQRMIPADVSGVLFTANPLNNTREECLINANWGLGESVVSGEVTPDEFVVSKSGLIIKQAQIAEKTAMMPFGHSGRQMVPVPTIRQKHACLTNHQLQKLAAIGKLIETHYGAPQDIEWSFAGERLYILQSRPITTMTAAPRPVAAWDQQAAALFKDTVIFWSNLNVRETMPYPHLPLSWSYWKDALIGGLIESLSGLDRQAPLFPYYCPFDLVFGRIYLNLNLLYNYPVIGTVLRWFAPMVDKEAGTIWNALYHRGELRAVASPKQSVRETLRGLGQIARLACRFVRPDRTITFDEVARAQWQQAVAFEHLELSARSTGDLLKAVKDQTVAVMMFVITRAWMMVSVFVGYGLLQWLTRAWPGIPADKLLAGIPGNKTTAAALEMYRLSLMPDMLRAQFLQGTLADLPDRLQTSPEGRNWLIRFRDFLERYGHRGARELDLSEPRWQENPTFVFQMIRNYLQLDAADTTPAQHFENMRRERERLTALACARLSRGFWGRFLPWKRWLFSTLLPYVQRGMPFRENFKYYVLKIFPGVRRIFAEIGRRLCQAGYLTTAEDVYFLTLPELETWTPGNAADQHLVAQRIAQRKEEWRANRAMNPPSVVRSDGKPVAVLPKTEPGTKILRGVSASSGKITGKARIILDPSDGAAFNKGEILVAPFTDPGWTPLFLTATALVMEVGGLMCHGAVVAREYGIPAIVGVKDALTRIRTGDIITVDGDAGQVVLS